MFLGKLNEILDLSGLPRDTVAGRDILMNCLTILLNFVKTGNMTEASERPILDDEEADQRLQQIYRTVVGTSLETKETKSQVSTPKSRLYQYSDFYRLAKEVAAQAEPEGALSSELGSVEILIQSFSTHRRLFRLSLPTALSSEKFPGLLLGVTSPRVCTDDMVAVLVGCSTRRLQDAGYLASNNGGG